MAAEAVAPRAGRVDAIGVHAVGELRAGKQWRGFLEALRQFFQIGHDNADGAAQALGAAARQVALAAADVDPHVVEAGEQIRVAREAEPRDVERGRQLLVGNRQIDVFERDDVADVFTLAVVRGRHASLPRSVPEQSAASCHDCAVADIAPHLHAVEADLFGHFVGAAAARS